MKFESGMVGFLIVVLAIGGSIFGTILLSAEESTHDVTKYRFETEVTGLFPVDTSPEFYDYDLSRNYTGYFTPDSMVNGVNYFDGATYRDTTVNNYPVKLAPASDTTSTETLADSLTPSTPPGNNQLRVVVWGNAIYTNPGNYQCENWTYDAMSVSLSTIISTYDLSGYDIITIVPSSETASSRVLFDSKENIEYKGYGYNTYGVDYVMNSYVNSGTYPPEGLYTTPTVACLSCKINKITQEVQMFYGTEPMNSQFVKTVKLSDAVIIYDNGDNTEFPAAKLGNEVIITAHNDPELKYMDISNGVTVTGVTP